MRTTTKLLCLSALLVSTAACGGDTQDDDSVARPSTGSDAATSAGGTSEPTRTIDPATVGRVRGTVRVTGSAPAPQPLTIVGEAYCVTVHKDTPIVDERLIVNAGAVQDAFVWVKTGLEDYAFETPTESVVLDQQGCRYIPHVAGVMTRQTLLAQNSDGVMHNVHTKPERNKEKNFGIPAGGDPRTLDFRRDEVMVEVICDVHAWMKSWIGVVSHPFFAVTGADGAFAIEGLPPGEYVLGVWQETLGTLELPFTLEAKGEASVEPSWSL